mmetsp:Transcript_21954/g.49644  ORF Transcript_21954/g.49644 Transcript_21954/m.49644 type:complete len:131 (-) Transcript_21954:13-405(-)
MTEMKPEVKAGTSDESTKTEHLTITIQTNSGDKTQFKVKPHTKMAKVFAAFGERKGVETNTFRFLYDGDRIGPEASPASLGLEENDVIDAFLEQVGGVTGSGGRVRMPHNNRVSSSASMQMTSIWTNTIG